ncbi:hypothetical protein LTR36_001359 [Oleoguttula mirabilis]|uniref:SET domain-containing protein n=1 Tax=Oleoguttula mirabilis TaxID=1507867 RepID=A0AAV9JNK0_9PEZI|nr:hypothetical protein LTR36_001359 [Oleoguttula mirabilis]
MPLQYITSKGILHLRDVNVQNKTILVDATIRDELSRRVAATGLPAITSGRGPQIRALVLSKSPVRPSALAMAPRGSREIIDLSVSDDEIPQKSAQTRQPAATTARKSEVRLVPPRKEGSLKGPSSPRNARNHGLSRPHVDPPISNKLRTSTGNLSTPTSAQAVNRANVQEKTHGTERTSAGGANKPGFQGKARSFTASKEIHSSDDGSDDELAPADSFISPRAPPKTFVATRPEAKPSDPMRAGGAKRSREDGGSKIGPPKKRPKSNIKSDGSRLLTSGDGGVRPSKPHASLSARTGRPKSPTRKSYPGPTVDLTTPTKDVVNLLSDEDEEEEGRLAPRGGKAPGRQHSLLAGKSPTVRVQRHSNPRTLASDSGADKRLPSILNRDTTALSSAAPDTDREVRNRLPLATSALSTNMSATEQVGEKAGPSKDSSVASLNGQAGARSVYSGLKPASGRGPEPGHPLAALNGHEGGSETLDGKVTESNREETSNAGIATAGHPTGNQPDGTISALRNDEPAGPRRAFGAPRGLHANGPIPVSDMEQTSEQKPQRSDVDKGHASLNTNGRIAEDGPDNTAQAHAGSGMSGRPRKSDELAAQNSVQDDSPTEPIVGHQDIDPEKALPQSTDHAKWPTAAAESMGASEPAKVRQSFTPVCASRSTDTHFEVPNPSATAQVEMSEAPALVEDAVTRNPASLPSNSLRDSASPIDKSAQAQPHGEGGEMEMELTNGESVDTGGADPGATPALQAQAQVHDPRKSKVVLFALGLSKQVEMVLGKYLEEMRGDNEYWNKHWLKRARISLDKPKPIVSQQTTAHAFAGRTGEPYSFAALKPLQLRPGGKTTSGGHTAQFTVEKMAPSGLKSNKISLSVPVTLLSIEDSMPNYSHAVSIKCNFLAPNTKSLQYWPYFGDNFDFDEAESLKEQYTLDIHKRPRKLLRLLQAQKLDVYVEDALLELDLVWDDVLRFLLEVEPDVGSDPDAKQALLARHESCSEDFSRNHQRTAIVLSSLRPSSPEKLARAAVLCEIFHKMSWISLWHVARRHQLRAVPDDGFIDKTDLVNELTCRVCLRFDCPYHGEIDEHDDSDDDADSESAVDKAIVTDIICPPKVNYRTRMAFPATFEAPVAAELSLAQKKDRHAVEFWQGKDADQLWKHEADERGPFYPCDHPGLSCEEEDCCACSTEKMRKGRKLVCFDDDRCVCYRLGRECDPDLCGACGVLEVLDPVNRYNDHVLRGRCCNASTQRGVPKRTLLGDSGIHGFGLYAGEDIRRHEFVGEYKGEVITKEEAERRGAVYEFQKLSYLFSLNNKQEIDSTYFGNKIRFINHGGNGKNTLYPRIFLVNAVHRIALYADRSIKSGEELLFDYGPKFPNEQLGGKTSVPRVRNSDLVHEEFYDIEYEMDDSGNRRARKALAPKPRGRPPKAETGGPAGTKKRGGARPGSGRKPHKSAPEPVLYDDEDDLEAGGSAGARLAAFNISDDVDAMEDAASAGADEDDVFEPAESVDEESEASEEDEDDDTGGMAAGRFRGVRGRPRRRPDL